MRLASNRHNHILLVDDNPSDRALVAREVRRDHPGAALIEVSRPDQLDKALSNGRLSLAVLDFSLGWSTGLEVLKRIRAADADCPAILFTGSLGEEAAAEAIKAGFDDYIIKSVERLPRLRASIDALLKQKEERQARRKAEARYRALFDNVTVGLFACAADGTFEDGNDAVLRLLAVPNVNALRRHSLFDFAQGAAVREAWRKMLSEDPASGINSMEIELSGGNRRTWVLLDAFPVDAARTQIEGLLTDVTALKNALEERSALLSEVHHRVRNNLQIVQSLLHFQGRRFPHPEVKAAFNEVAGRVNSLSLIQQQLYESEDYAAVDFAAYLRRLVHALMHLSHRPEVTPVLDLETIRIPLEKAMPLGLIANELLTNTMKHAFPGGRAGEVRLALRRVDDAILLSVADNGVGVATSETGSTGLGMRLVPRLTAQLGATVTTDTSNGYATTVRFAA